MVAMGGQLRSHSALAGRPARGLRATVRSGHPSAHPVVDAVPTQPATSPTTEEEPQVADDILNTIIGKPTGTTVVTVERGQLALFASAVKDESPIYRDPRAAAEAGLPGIPAPPTYPLVMGNFGAYPELQPGDAPSGNPMAADTAASPSDDVLRRIEDGIAWITLNRPAAGNALTTDMREQLVAWLEESSADLAVRVVVLTGAGRLPASGGRRPCRIPFPPPRP